MASVGATVSTVWRTVAQHRTVPHDLRETAIGVSLVCRVRVPIGRRVRALRQLASSGNRLLNGVEQVVVATRFGEELDGPGLHGAYRHRAITVPGDKYNGNLTTDLDQFLLQIQAT